MPELMTRLAELVTEIDRINPALTDPLRHAKRECKQLAQTALEHAVTQAWMALRTVEQIEEAHRENQISNAAAVDS